ncbi:MAG: PTS sugar transporter subunit IIA [Proteobacteria bacterium]|nr:MAG: PTS sugar transporter subunit IIA [Pseudomonadota bacterium]
MGVVDILTPARITIDVHAASKKAVLEVLARLVTGDTSQLTPAQAFDGLIVRERLGSTGLGHGIAIPHARIEHLSVMVGAFLRTHSAVDFDAIDGKPVDLFFALIVPVDTTEQHLAMLANLARSFSDPKLVASLREVASTQMIHALLVGSSVEA